MSTKSEKFHATTLVTRALENVASRKTARGPATPAAKAHNLSARAGRNARVAYEQTEGRPSRRSTRASAHHQRASNQLERTHQLAQAAPERRASVSRTRSLKFRGKP